MSKNAIIDELGWKPSKIKSGVTKKMIDEYKAEMNQPIKVFDPVRGKDVIFKYKPSSIDLTPITPNYTEPFDAKDIAIREKQILDRLNMIKNIDDYLSKTIPAEQKKINEDYNKAVNIFALKSTALDYTQLRTDITFATTHASINQIGNKLGVKLDPKKPKIEDKKIILNDKISELELAIDPTSKFENEMTQLNERIIKAEEHQKQLEFEIDLIQRELNDNVKVKKQNVINIAEAEKQNKAKINEALDELRVLNSGRSIPLQQAGESDDEYRKRLIDIGREVLDDDEIEREAGELQFVKGKYNLKELLSDDGKIETILKKLTIDEKTEMNTMFTGIKKKFGSIWIQ